MLCRYDTKSLKSLDIFSVHGFPVGLVQCESNLIGVTNGAGVNVGSGGWINIYEKYFRAKQYCEHPFEIRRDGSSKQLVEIKGESIGTRRANGTDRDIIIRCASSTDTQLPEQCLDGVFTDPPYFGNVQYGELMDFCYVWLRRLAGEKAEGFHRESTRSVDELTGNITEARGLVHFTDGLSRVYSNMVSALKPGAPFVFTFHHNRIEAYHAVAVATLDAGLTCSATIPIPAEMGGSIHIHGTGSSIIDTVFVCRTHGKARRSSLCERPAELIDLIRTEIGELRSAGVKPTMGDIRCITFGHLTRLGIWAMRGVWDKHLDTRERVMRMVDFVEKFGNAEAIAKAIATLELAHDPKYPIRKPSGVLELREDTSADFWDWVEI